MIREVLQNIGEELRSGASLMVSMPGWDNRAYLRHKVLDIVGREMHGDYVPHLDLLFIRLKATPAQRESLDLFRETVREDSGPDSVETSPGEQARMTGEEEV